MRQRSEENIINAKMLSFTVHEITARMIGVLNTTKPPRYHYFKHLPSEIFFIVQMYCSVFALHNQCTVYVA